MKSITLQEAHRLIDNASAIICDGHALVYPIVNDLTGDEDNEWLEVSWDEDHSVYEFKVTEAPQDIRFDGTNVYLNDTNGDETKITLLQKVGDTEARDLHLLADAEKMLSGAFRAIELVGEWEEGFSKLIDRLRTRLAETDKQPDLCADFDADQQWDHTDHAIDYISRQPNPHTALMAIAEANVEWGEKGWAAELLSEAPDEWQAPTTHVLQSAANILTDYTAYWEYPGYLSIETEGFKFAFGDANGAIGYDYNLPGEEEGDVRHAGDKQISPTLSCARIAEYIAEQIQLTKTKHQGEHSAAL